MIFKILEKHLYLNEEFLQGGKHVVKTPPTGFEPMTYRLTACRSAN